MPQESSRTGDAVSEHYEHLLQTRQHPAAAFALSLAKKGASDPPSLPWAGNFRKSLELLG